MKKSLCGLAVLAAFFAARCADAYHPVVDVTDANRKTCGIELQVKASFKSNLAELSLVVPLKACPEEYLLQKAILQVMKEGPVAGDDTGVLLVCPMTNFAGCLIDGESLELKFKIDAKFIDSSYVILTYGAENGMTYKIHLKSRVPPGP